MARQRHLALVFFLLAAAAALAVSLGGAAASAAPTAQAAPPVEAPAAEVAATPPSHGWLHLSGYHDYVSTGSSTELGNPTGGSFTFEGRFKLRRTLSSTTGSAFASASNFALGWEYYHVPKEASDLYFELITSCTGLNLTRDLAPDRICTVVRTRTAGFPYDGWRHLAVAFDQAAGRARLFLDGDYLVGVSAGTIISVTASGLFMGNLGNAPELILGIDEVRLSDVARYTRSFTPPAGPFRCDEHTLALWHFDEAAGATTFHDACGAVDNVLTGCGGVCAEGPGEYRVYVPVADR